VDPFAPQHLTNKHVVRKRFRQVRLLKPSDREYADPLGSVLRLPRFDGPRMLFDCSVAGLIPRPFESSSTQS